MTKNKIKKSKISSASLKKIPEKEKDYLAAILEEMRSDFRAFGESLDFVRKKGDETFEEVGKIKVEMEEMNFRLTNVEDEIKLIKSEIKLVNARLTNIEDEVKLIRSDLEALKMSLTKKSDIDFLKKFEARLIIVERHLKLAQ